MSTCVRGGFRYKRHKIENGVCKHCGGVSVPQEVKFAMVNRAASAMAEELRAQELKKFMALQAEGNHIG